MRRAFLHTINMAWLCLQLCIPCVTRSQSVPVPRTETPNVAALDNFGDVPVDMATGVPDISIPLHTLHCGNINVPIELRYHPSSLRLADHPSWVGTGWDLESGGAITRTVQYLPDEFYGTVNIMNNGKSPYTTAPISNPPTSGAQMIYNNSNWATPATLATYWGSPNGLTTDVCADEFSYNVMGHSGKFYYTASGWQVVSDENVQVQQLATPLLTNNAVVQSINNEFPGNQTIWWPSGNLDPTYATYAFSGFILTVPDGTKFYFGGVDANGNGYGIEWYTLYPPPQFTLQFSTNTWLLTKIVDVDGNTVNFNYSASYPTADLGFGYNADSWSCQQTSGGFLGQVYSSGWAYRTAVDNLIHSGTLKIPLYLDNITCPNETVTFHRQQAACLRFTDLTFEQIDLGGTNYQTDPGNGFNLNILGQNKVVNGVAINPAQNLQWMQLSNFIVSNGYGQTARTVNFNYSNTSSQRLWLGSIQELDNTGTSVEKYSFTYNSLGSLPVYDGNYADHWGFYNSLNVNGAQNPNASDQTQSSIYYFKNSDPIQVLTGLLTKITYPTGGNVQLTWQPHNYSQTVTSTATVSRQALSSPSNVALAAGCCRIGEIQSYLASGALARDKKYFYVRGYTNANQNGTYSSGILDGTPSYTMTLSNRTGLHGQTNENISVTMLNSMAIYSYNSEGSYIGYDQVVQQNEDNSYMINYYSSYGPDYNGISHWDQQPLGSLGWLPSDNYYNVSDLSRERGKLIASQKYNANGVLVQSTVNTYRNDPTRFNNYLRQITFNGSFSGCAAFDALVLATATQHFIYDYYVTSTTVTTYDQNGKNPQAVTTGYTYNSNNLVSMKTETDSKGEVIGTTYKYPPDMTDVTSQAMTTAHILTPVEQITITNNGTPVSTTTTNYYSPGTGLYKPQSVQIQFGSNATETRQSFFNYDSYGNVAEQAKTNDIHDIYLWGYFGQYPVCKITGTTMTALNTAYPNIQQQLTTLTSTATTPPTDAQVRSLLLPLQTGLNGALVTIFTYQPLSGMTSQTDPRGLKTFYQYDNFQRLQMISDNDGNVLKTLTYNYEITQ